MIDNIYLCHCNGYYYVQKSFCRDFYFDRKQTIKSKEHIKNFFVRMIPITKTYIVLNNFTQAGGLSYFITLLFGDKVTLSPYNGKK